MAQTKRKKTQSQDPFTQSLGEMSDSSKPRSNGVKSAPKVPAAAKNSSSSSGKDKAPKKTSSKKPPSKNDASSKKKQKRKGDKDDAPPPSKKRKNKPEPGSARASYAGTDDDSSDEEDGGSPREYPRLPEVIMHVLLGLVGDEIAIKCPPDPPYPEGWYTGVVADVVVLDDDREGFNAKKGPQSSHWVENFTLRVEWDGGGEETLHNPEWRLKGDAPDKQGRVSHRDAKLRPYFKYWVNRLNSMAESEKKLSRFRVGKNTRVDPDQKIEWIQCSSPSCGKWRPLPPYMKSSAILESCNNKWFCVLNSWDEALASCGAPQETGYMPV
ncbi:hypothetical protein ACHAXR_008642 [Thalassiosira sp. AJA248-18]